MKFLKKTVIFFLSLSCLNGDYAYGGTRPTPPSLAQIEKVLETGGRKYSKTEIEKFAKQIYNTGVVPRAAIWTWKKDAGIKLYFYYFYFRTKSNSKKIVFYVLPNILIFLSWIIVYNYTPFWKVEGKLSFPIKQFSLGEVREGSLIIKSWPGRKVFLRHLSEGVTIKGLGPNKEVVIPPTGFIILKIKHKIFQNLPQRPHLEIFLNGYQAFNFRLFQKIFLWQGRWSIYSDIFIPSDFSWGLSNPKIDFERDSVRFKVEKSKESIQINLNAFILTQENEKTEVPHTSDNDYFEIFFSNIKKNSSQLIVEGRWFYQSKTKTLNISTYFKANETKKQLEKILKESKRLSESKNDLNEKSRLCKEYLTSLQNISQLISNNKWSHLNELFKKALEETTRSQKTILNKQELSIQNKKIQAIERQKFLEKIKNTKKVDSQYILITKQKMIKIGFDQNKINETERFLLQREKELLSQKEDKKLKLVRQNSLKEQSEEAVEKLNRAFSDFDNLLKDLWASFGTESILNKEKQLKPQYLDGFGKILNIINEIDEFLGQVIGGDQKHFVDPPFSLRQVGVLKGVDETLNIIKNIAPDGALYDILSGLDDLTRWNARLLYLINKRLPGLLKKAEQKKLLLNKSDIVLKKIEEAVNRNTLKFVNESLKMDVVKVYNHMSGPPNKDYPILNKKTWFNNTNRRLNRSSAIMGIKTNQSLLAERLELIKEDVKNYNLLIKKIDSLKNKNLHLKKDLDDFIEIVKLYYELALEKENVILLNYDFLMVSQMLYGLYSESDKYFKLLDFLDMSGVLNSFHPRKKSFFWNSDRKQVKKVRKELGLILYAYSFLWLPPTLEENKKFSSYKKIPLQKSYRPWSIILKQFDLDDKLQQKRVLEICERSNFLVERLCQEENEGKIPFFDLNCLYEQKETIEEKFLGRKNFLQKLEKMKGIDLGCTDSKGNNILHLCMKSTHNLLLKDLVEKHRSTVRRLKTEKNKLGLVPSHVDWESFQKRNIVSKTMSIIPSMLISSKEEHKDMVRILEKA